MTIEFSEVCHSSDVWFSRVRATTLSFQKKCNVFVAPFGVGVEKVSIRCCPCFVDRPFESSPVRLYDPAIEKYPAVVFRWLRIRHSGYEFARGLEISEHILGLNFYAHVPLESANDVRK